jgi:transposase
MKEYCNYYKNDVINYYNKTKSIKKILMSYGICRKTLYNWRQLYKKELLYNKTKYKQQVSYKYSEEISQYIKQYIINKDNFKIKTLIRTINRKFDCFIKATNIYYLLNKLNITYKKAHKVVRINKIKHKNDVKKLKKTVNEISHDKIISTDECHFQTNMKPNRGWNIKGKRVTFTKNTGVRTNVSLICSVTNKKILHFEIHRTSVNKDVFINYIKKVNKKSNRKHILLDNARVHHSIDLKKYMSNISNKLLYNVPYNPETNPIEQMFNKIKQFVKKENTQTYKKLVRAIII